MSYTVITLATRRNADIQIRKSRAEPPQRLLLHPSPNHGFTGLEQCYRAQAIDDGVQAADVRRLGPVDWNHSTLTLIHQQVHQMECSPLVPFDGTIVSYELDNSHLS